MNELKTDDGTKLLAKQYEKINFIADDKAIAVYLNPQKYKLQAQNTSPLIFPFGCNASQQKAVQAAFENQISVVQGPPGTGKTQTILNIIDNILVRGKTVQVVSNNNSAIVNVLEKLSKYDMGFIVALLGSTANKEKFIETQEEKQYPENFESWHNAEADMYHKSGTRQSERDVKKDHILELYGIPLVRLSTIGSNEKKVIVDKLSEVQHYGI